MLNFIKLCLVFFITNALLGLGAAILVALIFFWDTVWNVIFIGIFASIALVVFG